MLNYIKSAFYLFIETIIIFIVIAVTISIVNLSMTPSHSELEGLGVMVYYIISIIISQILFVFLINHQLKLLFNNINFDDLTSFFKKFTKCLYLILFYNALIFIIVSTSILLIGNFWYYYSYAYIPYYYNYTIIPFVGAIDITFFLISIIFSIRYKSKSCPIPNHQ